MANDQGPTTNDQRPRTNDYSIIGKSVAMIDAAGKTTGSGKYTDDLSLPGMLYGKILHSPHPHARITSIHTSRPVRLSGRVPGVTAKDEPHPFCRLPAGHYGPA